MFGAGAGVEVSFVFAGNELRQSGRPSRAYRTDESPSDKWIRHVPGVEGACGPSHLATSVGIVRRPGDQSSPLKSSP